MKAVLFHQHGGPEVLQYTDFPTPEPKPGEALVRLRAASLNRVDIFARNGWPGLKLEMPHINGADGAGEVVAFGLPLPLGEGLGVRAARQTAGIASSSCFNRAASFGASSTGCQRA